MAKMARAQPTPEELVVAQLTGQLNTALSAAASRGNASMAFVVPAFVVGVPAYNHAAVAARLKQRLEAGGYAVALGGGTTRAPPMSLLVSWDHDVRKTGDLVATRD